MVGATDYALAQPGVRRLEGAKKTMSMRLLVVGLGERRYRIERP
jgi:hypothetical protein